MMPHRSVLFWLTLLFVLGGLSRVVLVRKLPIRTPEALRQEMGDERYYVEIAQTMVNEGEFREGYLRAYRPPGYPTFLALHLYLFGGNLGAAQVTQNLLFVCAIALIGWTSSRFLGTSTALLSAFFLFINPVWMSLPQQAYSESLLIALLSLAIFLSVRIQGSDSWPTALAAGAVFGLCALVKEIGLVIGLGTLLVIWYTLRQRNVGGYGRAAVVFAAGMFLVVTPWTVRNYLVFDRFVLITTNSTINLYMGNNPEATGSMHWALPEKAKALWQTPSERGAHEIAVSRMCGREAFAYMREHPWRTVALWPTKFWALWGPHRSVESRSTFDTLFRLYRSLIWPPYLLLSCYGLWLLRSEVLGRIILTGALLGTLIHLLTYAMPLYRAPHEFLFSIPAAWALLQVTGKVSVREPSGC